MLIVAVFFDVFYRPQNAVMIFIGNVFVKSHDLGTRASSLQRSRSDLNHFI
jgi:hypothetical protein